MLVDLWLRAFKAEIGIAITTDNRAVLRQHLYRARVEANNPDLDTMVMLLSAKEDELWIVHRDADGLGANNQGNIEPLFPRR